MRRGLIVALGLSVGMAALASPAAAQDGSTQRFIVLVTGSGAEETTRVIAVGPITGVGTFEETEDENLVRFVFANGSVTLFVPTEEESEEFDPLTCSGSFTFSGPWEIVEGTGAYQDATGSGEYFGSGRFVGIPGTDCSDEEGFFFLIVHATGTADTSGQAAA